MKNKFRPPSTRKMLGLKLDELAPFLEVSTSLLSMYELNQRDLSGRAFIKASCINACLYSQPAASRPGVNETGEQVAVLKKRYLQCQQLLGRAEDRLLKMKEQEACQLNLVKVCHELAATLNRFMPSLELTAFEENWLRDYASIAKSRLKKCGQPQQQLLQVKIDALKHEMQLLEPLLLQKEQMI